MGAKRGSLKLKPRNFLTKGKPFNNPKQKERPCKKLERGQQWTELSWLMSEPYYTCRITHNTTHTGLLVGYDVKTKGPWRPSRRIPVRGRSLVDSFFPSVEGTVIWCQLESGEERYYDTCTGKRLRKKELQKLNRTKQLHFLQ